MPKRRSKLARWHPDCEAPSGPVSPQGGVRLGIALGVVSFSLLSWLILDSRFVNRGVKVGIALWVLTIASRPPLRVGSNSARPAGIKIYIAPLGGDHHGSDFRGLVMHSLGSVLTADAAEVLPGACMR